MALFALGVVYGGRRYVGRHDETYHRSLVLDVRTGFRGLVEIREDPSGANVGTWIDPDGMAYVPVPKSGVVLVRGVDELYGRTRPSARYGNGIVLPNVDSKADDAGAGGLTASWVGLTGFGPSLQDGGKSYSFWFLIGTEADRLRVDPNGDLKAGPLPPATTNCLPISLHQVPGFVSYGKWQGFLREHCPHRPGASGSRMCDLPDGTHYAEVGDVDTSEVYSFDAKGDLVGVRGWLEPPLPEPRCTIAGIVPEHAPGNCTPVVCPDPPNYAAALACANRSVPRVTVGSCRCAGCIPAVQKAWRHLFRASLESRLEVAEEAKIDASDPLLDNLGGCSDALPELVCCEASEQTIMFRAAGDNVCFGVGVLLDGGVYDYDPSLRCKHWHEQPECAEIVVHDDAGRGQ
jgi:hypothetical protein